MANTLLTPQMITKEALAVIVNSVRLAGKVNRQYDSKFGVDGAKIGDTLNIRKPPRYMGRSGQALAVEDITETSIPLTLTTQFGVDLAVTSKDLALNIDMFSKRIVKPAIAAISNRVDFDTSLLYQTVNNAIGTPGSSVNALLTILQVGQRLNEEAAPISDRTLVITPANEATMVDALKGLFHDGTMIKEQYDSGMIGRGLGFDEWYMDQNLRTHKVGPLGGSPVVNGAGQTGASLITNGWTAAAANRLKKGDVFTIANVNAVNPQNRQSTGALRQFVVTADVSSDGSGNATIPIFPAIIAAGPFQNVDSTPANSAALTIFGAANTSTPQALAFCKDAFVLAFADLPSFEGVDMMQRPAINSGSPDDQNDVGVALRLIRAYDINTDRAPMRVECLYGTAPLYSQEEACRLAS